MSISLEQLSAQMRRGEQVPLRHTMQVVLTLSIPSILQQIVVTAVEYIDAAMVGHIGASATASIGIVSSSTWLMHGMLAGLYMSFAIQVAQYLGADRQDDASAMHSTKIRPEPRALPLESAPFTANSRPWSCGSLS